MSKRTKGEKQINTTDQVSTVRKKNDSKDQSSIPENKPLEFVLTVILFIQWVVCLVTLGSTMSGVINLSVALFVQIAGMKFIKMIFTSFGYWIVKITSNKSNQKIKDTNIIKFRDQSWNFVNHSIFTLWELYFFAQYGWWSDTNSCWTDEPVPESVRQFYTLQLVSYLVIGFTHRFTEKRHKDYFVMFIHHIMTITLICGSLIMKEEKIGVVVVFIHDISDIPVDLTKMTNYLQLGSESGLYLTEASFITLLVTWLYSRLYLFPTHVIYSTIYESGTTCLPLCDDTLYTKAHCVLRVFLMVLVLLHVYWFGLFLKIVLKLLGGSKGHAAARDSYEGDSD